MRARIYLLLTTFVLAFAVAGCGVGGASSSSAAGPIADVDLSDAEFTVGSKDFTEQLMLGQITFQALEAAGADVTDQIGLAGTDATREALKSGDIDMYWEYTGTGWINHLGNTDPIPGREAQFEAVAEADLEQNDIKWLSPPAPANNTFAITVSNENAEDLGVQTISDLGRLIEERPEEATFCTDSEFATRDDALPGLEETYGFEFPDQNIKTVAIGVIPSSVDEGEPCNFGVMQATDGRIPALDLTVLEDNEDFFPLYNPALVMREETFEEYPQMQDLISPIAEELDTETLQNLNAAVDSEGREPEDVAEEWLSEQGFIE